MLLGTLRNRLLAVLLLGIAPALFAVMLLAVALLARDVRKSMVEANVVSLVRLVAEIHDRTLQSTRTVLMSLAAEHDISPQHCVGHFRRVLADSTDLDGLTLLSPDGRIRCSDGRGADIAWQARLPVVRAALETGAFAAGPHLYSGGETLSLPMAVPVRDDSGRIVAVLVAVRRYDWLTGELSRQTLPSDGQIFVVDRAATVIARLGSAARVGMSLPVEPVAGAVRQGETGSLTTRGGDGVDRVFAYGHLSSEMTDMFAVISVPERAVLGPARLYYWLIIGGFAFAGLGTIVMLYLAGRWLVFVPTSRLLDVIGRVQSGDRRARAGEVRAYGELEQIAAAFDSMLDELDRRQARFRDLFDQSPDAILAHDLSGRLTDANTALVRLAGLPRQRLLGMDVCALIVDAEPPCCRETWHALQPGQPVTVAGQLRRADGTVLPVETHLAPLGSGETRQVVAVVRDLTAQNQARTALEAALDQAQLASRAKSDFLASMSHELRTPLNAVIGFGEAMTLEVFGPLSPKYREYAQDIVESGSHLLDLISDILDLAKIEAGRVELSEEKVGLEPLIDAAVKLLRGRAERSGIHLDIRLPDAPVTVLVDPRRLKQVVINLLTNAVKFTPAGGSVTVTVTLPPDRGIEIILADTGIGMRKEDIPHALEPFGQVGRSVTRPNEGTGLGLALVRGIVDMHGGRMDIDSDPGRGTTVTVTLPPERLVRQ